MWGADSLADPPSLPSWGTTSGSSGARKSRLFGYCCYSVAISSSDPNRYGDGCMGTIHSAPRMLTIAAIPFLGYAFSISHTTSKKATSRWSSCRSYGANWAVLRMSPVCSSFFPARCRTKPTFCAVGVVVSDHDQVHVVERRPCGLYGLADVLRHGEVVRIDQHLFAAAHDQKARVVDVRDLDGTGVLGSGDHGTTVGVGVGGGGVGESATVWPHAASSRKHIRTVRTPTRLRRVTGATLPP